MNVLKDAAEAAGYVLLLVVAVALVGAALLAPLAVTIVAVTWAVKQILAG